MYSLKTRAEMHALFQQLGFQKKGVERIPSIVVEQDKRLQEVVNEELARIEEQQQQQQLQPMYVSNIIGMYGVIGFVSLAFLLLIRCSGKKRRRVLKIGLPVRV